RPVHAVHASGNDLSSRLAHQVVQGAVQLGVRTLRRAGLELVLASPERYGHSDGPIKPPPGPPVAAFVLGRMMHRQSHSFVDAPIVAQAVGMEGTSRLHSFFVAIGS